MSRTHDPDRRRDIPHVGPVELCTPVLEESRDFFVRVMGLREVHRDATSPARKLSGGWCR